MRFHINATVNIARQETSVSFRLLWLENEEELNNISVSLKFFFDFLLMLEAINWSKPHVQSPYEANYLGFWVLNTNIYIYLYISRLINLQLMIFLLLWGHKNKLRTLNQHIFIRFFISSELNTHFFFPEPELLSTVLQFNSTLIFKELLIKALSIKKKNLYDARWLLDCC